MKPASSSRSRACGVLALALLATGAATSAHAQRMPREDVIDVPAVGKGLCVSNLFQSHMVLQRDKAIRIWGWAASGDTVTVSFAGEEAKATAGADRRWSVTLPAMPANKTPRVVRIRTAEDKIELKDVLVGDVWVLGGQSNMEFPLERVENGWLEIVSAKYRELRILTVPAQNGVETRKSFPRLHEWSGWFGRHFRKGDWGVCSPKIARELSAIGYVFARRIHMTSGVPIGVIDASRGGTTVETWTPEAVLRATETPEVAALMTNWDERCAQWDAEKDLANRIRNHERRVADRKKRGQAIPANWKKPDDLRPGPALDHNRPSACYKNMIAPLAGLSVKGVIFHQGYNNALTGAPGARMYYQLFSKMIAAWREAFGDAKLPFGIISLCTDGKPQTRENYSEFMLDGGVYIREAQYRTFEDLWRAGDRNIGFASSFDKRRSWYHPQVKIPVGERIARWALSTQYDAGRQIRWKPPAITEMKTENGAITLRFDQNVSADDSGAAIAGFAIAGADRRFHPAKAEHFIKGRDKRNRPQKDQKALVLTSPQVPQPLHFRYAWGRSPLGNLQASGNSDLPIATQRSDDWPLHDVPRGVLGGEKLKDGRLSRGQRGKIRRALRQQDLDRRLDEARALLRQHAPKKKTKKK